MKAWGKIGDTVPIFADGFENGPSIFFADRREYLAV
jgi:hypothetical protein